MRYNNLWRNRVYRTPCTCLSNTGGGDYKVPLVWLSKVLNSISKKGHHVLVQERCVYKVLNSEILNFLKVWDSKVFASL